LEKSLIESSERIADNVEGLITANMTRMSESVVSSHTKWLITLGLIEMAMGNNGETNVVPNAVVPNAVKPDAIVQRLISGQYYKPDSSSGKSGTSGWSLSKSIWGDNQQTHKQILDIVEGGRVQGKPIYEISKDLERFVNPDKRNPWNLVNAQGRTIYPRQVDYNAQRLARTMVQHSYQQSFLESVKNDVFVESVRWIANGSRVCPLCEERDGKIFPKDDVPLDHPNGMCVFEPVYVENWKRKIWDIV
jgi:SPP1 gp7 family putative phage head morphogenesis protein